MVYIEDCKRVRYYICFPNNSARELLPCEIFIEQCVDEFTKLKGEFIIGNRAEIDFITTGEWDNEALNDFLRQFEVDPGGDNV